MTSPDCLHCQIGNLLHEHNDGEHDAREVLDALAEVIGDILNCAPVEVRASLILRVGGRICADLQEIQAGTYKDGGVRH